MSKRFLLSIAFVLTILVTVAQVPATLSYQGLLTDAAGVPFPDKDYNLVFKFYLDAAAGTEVHTCGPITVTTFKGLFTAILGTGGSSNLPLPYLLGDKQYFIGISVDAKQELTPRVLLTAVPYAFTANTAKNIDGASINSGTVPTARLDANLQDLSDGSLTGSKVGTGINATNITTGSLTGSLVGTGISATNITTGTLPNTVLDANLIDLADGSLTGNKVGTGISATNITTGSLSGSLVGSGISATNITTGTLALTGTDASKLASGTTAQRPVSPVEGTIRYNSTEKVMEYYNGTDWYFVAPKIAFIKDAKIGGTEGGSSSSGNWHLRDLNVITGDKSFVALNSSNSFTLTAGEYYIEASSPAFLSDRHKLRLYNKTDLTDQIGSIDANGLMSNSMGTSQYNANGTVVTRSELVSTFIISKQTTFEVQHFF